MKSVFSQCYTKLLKEYTRPLVAFTNPNTIHNFIEYDTFWKRKQITGNVLFSGRNLTELPDLSDVYVYGDFSCSFNNLKSLKGSPMEVKFSFMCTNNILENLEYMTQKIGNDVDCSNNNLKSLYGAPDTINGIFNCSSNNLKSLQYSPRIVRGAFNCKQNDLNSLQGLPETIDGNFIWYNNNKITKEDFLKSIIFSNITGQYFSGPPARYPFPVIDKDEVLKLIDHEQRKARLPIVDDFDTEDDISKW